MISRNDQYNYDHNSYEIKVMAVSGNSSGEAGTRAAIPASSRGLKGDRNCGDNQYSYNHISD
jgi:hypothetical protein